MFSKPIICVALACAGVGHAVRRDFKMDRPAGVVEGLSALIQKHASPSGVQSAMQILQKAQKAVQGITPGAKDAMNVALNSVISEIESNVETKIQQNFEATQTAINAAAGRLTDTTNTAVAAHAAAVTADEVLVACYGTEQSKLAAVESAEASLAAAREAKIQPCAEQDAAAPYSKEFAEQDLVFECDISTTGNCDGPLEAFEQRIQGLLTELQSDVNEKTAIFTEAKGRCDAAKAAIVAAEAALDNAVNVYIDQREQCMRDHEERQVRACVFGADLASKCVSRSDFEALDVEIDGAGNPHSESDRMSEWEATATTKCMLQRIVQSADLVNANINEESLASCAGEVNYVRDVGTLDRKASDFAALTTAEKFTCAESEIELSGFLWAVPAITEDGARPASSQFHKDAFKEPVSAKNDAKFSFC